MEGLAVRDPSFWSERRVLVTGHTGFKGAWLSLWLEILGAAVVGLSLPPESPEGAFRCLEPWDGLDSHIADLRDPVSVEQVMATAKPEVVFHLGAQSLVRRGWADPIGTYAVNVLGTAHLLEAVRRVPSVKAVVVATSDKVYAHLGAGAPFREDSPLGGEDPYSASKAAAEHVVSAWRAGKRGVPVATVRAGNVIGGGDIAEDRLLPDAWRALRAGQDLILRNPDATRPWQFVLEPLAGYLRLAQRLVEEPAAYPPAVNFGPPPSSCWPVSRVADVVVAAWGSGRWMYCHQTGAPPEAPSLRLDAGLADRALGWRSRLELTTAIGWTVEWWRKSATEAPLRPLATTQIEAYEGLSK